MVYCEKNENLTKNTLKEGFSLIEVMIVIMIGGLLVGGAFMGYQWYKRAQVDNTIRKMSSLDMAIETYKNQIGQYPRDLSELVNGPQSPALQKRWAEPIVKESDLKDSWDREFVYELSSKGSRTPYELYSTGSTGEAKIYSPRSQE